MLQLTQNQCPKKKSDLYRSKAAGCINEKLYYSSVELESLLERAEFSSTQTKGILSCSHFTHK